MTALDDVGTVIADDDRGVSPPPGEQIDVRGLGSEGGVRLRGVPTLVRASRAVAVTITAGIAVSSFVLSFAALSDLARRTGSWADWLPYLWPGIVDGAIVLATMGILTTAAYPDQRKNRQFFWSMLALGSLVSIGGNALHAILPASRLCDMAGLRGGLRPTRRNSWIHPRRADPLAVQPDTGAGARRQPPRRLAPMTQAPRSRRALVGDRPRDSSARQVDDTLRGHVDAGAVAVVRGATGDVVARDRRGGRGEPSRRHCPHPADRAGGGPRSPRIGSYGRSYRGSAGLSVVESDRAAVLRKGLRS